MTGKDAIPSISRGRQCTKPVSVICTKIGVGVSIRRSHTCRIGTGYPPRRWHIAVYVGDDGDPHRITCGLSPCEQPSVLSSSVPIPSDPIRFSSPVPISSLHS